MLAAIVLSMTLAAQPAGADDDDPAIFNATVDESAGESGEVTITGQGFPADPSVTFDGAEATIVGTPSATKIVIELPDGTGPGSYRLTVGEYMMTVECFDDGDACFEVAVGADGPAGGIAGRMVRSATVSITAGQQDFAVVSCVGPDEIATGGGFSSNTNLMRITVSEPTGNEWQVRGLSLASFTKTLTVVVVCLITS